MNDIQKLIDQMTLEEKAAIVAGVDFMYTNAVPRLKIPELSMSDGPHGLRKQKSGGDNGVAISEIATAFPTAATLACGWNRDNAAKLGAALAKECVHYGVNVLLGPAVNIKRNPLCGRNFEYFSEDGYLSGELAAAQVKSLQQGGVSACVKHFALNNSENFRFMGDSVADERAVREIYLKPFEYVVKKSKPAAVMCAYNKINGVACCENGELLNGILRGEWGFDGVVMTDWGAMRDRVRALYAGLDLEMPGDTRVCRKRIVDGVESGELDMSVLDSCVAHIIELTQKFGKINESDNFESVLRENDELAAEIAADCAVLMKNDGVLPLDKDEEIAVVGELFENMRYQGAGSSMINPARITSPKKAFEEQGVKFTYVRGYAVNNACFDRGEIEKTVESVKGFKKVLVFAGLTDYFESEGGDRENMRLPQNQTELINALTAAGIKPVVVLFGGSPVELPFLKDASAVINFYLPGQNGGTAVYKLLFGEQSPSGRLAETWVKNYSDVPFSGSFGKSPVEVYKESVFVGYRYYTTAGVEVAAPFGFGLSYTTFSYSDMALEETDGGFIAACTVKNTGTRFGGEVVQLYFEAPQGGVFRPKRELAAFKKIYLAAGESARVELFVEKSALAFFNVKENRPVLESGNYTFEFCLNCNSVALSKTVYVAGDAFELPYAQEINEVYSSCDFTRVTDEVFEKLSGLKIPAVPPQKPITMESRFTDLNATFFGRIIFKAVMIMPKRMKKRAKKAADGAERDNLLKGAEFLKRVLESGCLRSMSMNSPLLPYNVAEGIVLLSNGHILGAIKKFLSKIKTFKLPRRE